MSEMDFTAAAVLKRMRDGLQSPVNKMEGGFCMDNLQAVAEEISRLDTMEVRPIPDRVLLDTAEGEYLDRRALDYNETRNPATAATGLLLFTGEVGAFIPAGTGVMYGALIFETTAAVHIGIDGICEAPAKCRTTGQVGNVAAGTVTILRAAVEGVKSAINPAPFGGGAQAESDDAFRSRIFDKIRRPITSGNRNHYIYWAKQVPGVGAAKCLGAEVCGPGQVKVIILSDQFGVPDEVVLNHVSAHVEEERPIGARVTVTAAVPLEVNVNVVVTVAAGYSMADIQQNILTALQRYLDSVNRAEFAIPPAHGDEGRKSHLSFYRIGDLIFGVEGVSDIISYTLNGGLVSLSCEYIEYFKLGVVVINGS